MNTNDDVIKQDFMRWIEESSFPCIGAKAALRKEGITFVVAEHFSQAQDDVTILTALYQFIEQWHRLKDHLQSVVIIFKNHATSNEIDFEKSLWQRLQALHQLDSEIYDWDPDVSADVTDANFSFSIGGNAFFVVGLHPNSSRAARRFKYPALVFNLHQQFKKVRDDNFYNQMRDKIRANDAAYSGTVNPMVNDFGVSSEALQYSGRKVAEDHVCEFKRNEDTTEWQTIASSSGVGFELKQGDLLIVKDLQGEQVSDLFCFAKADKNEMLSSGKTLDNHSGIYLSTGHVLYSNLSRPMLTIIKDDVMRHDFLLSPCNIDTFKMLYDDCGIKTGCYEHLVQGLAPFNINQHYISTTFNIFMNVEVDAQGSLTILPPRSKAGDKIVFKSEMDLLVGLTACSAPKSNNHALKPIQYKIIKAQSKR